MAKKNSTKLKKGNLYFLGGNAGSQANSGINITGLVDTIIPGAGAASSLVNSVGDSVGGGWGAAIKGSISPLAAAFNKDLKPWQRIVGTINPALGGLFSYNQQKNAEDKVANNNAMKERNQLLGVRANGGPLTKYEVKDSKPFDDWYNSQPFYTEALQNKYKDLPVRDILGNASLDKSFKNSKLNQYSDSLTSKYGDRYLTETEVDSVARLNNIPNIFDLDRQIKESELSGVGLINNTMGLKENKLNKYGYRMMLNRSYPSGASPYKAAGGYILPQGVPQNIATQYADGGFLNEFNSGSGSHSEHPNGGIIQGYDDNGQPNKVEDGETKYKDYIFSDRLKLDKQAVEQHNLPKSMIKKTFADASKKIAKLHKERPNDPITRDTMRSQMDHLMMANDEIRQYEEFSMMAMGGNLYKDGGFKRHQQDLVDAGYNIKVDGVWGPKSQDAFNKYRASTNKSMIPMESISKTNLMSALPNTLEADKLQSKIDSTNGLDGKTNLGFTMPDLGFLGDTKSLRYTPIAFNALASTGLFGKTPTPETHSPTLIQQQGRLTAPRVNEEAMRAKIDAAYQNQIRGMAGASGGSGAALRAGLTGVGDDYMSAVGQGFLVAETANNQAKMQADQFNLGMTGNVAAQNAQMQNQAELYNNQMLNQNRALDYDTRMSYLGKAAEGVGDIGYEERMREIMPRIYGYTDLAKYAPGAKACGGRLRMMRHKK